MRDPLSVLEAMNHDATDPEMSNGYMQLKPYITKPIIPYVTISRYILT